MLANFEIDGALYLGIMPVLSACGRLLTLFWRDPLMAAFLLPLFDDGSAAAMICVLLFASVLYCEIGALALF